MLFNSYLIRGRAKKEGLDKICLPGPKRCSVKLQPQLRIPWSLLEIWKRMEMCCRRVREGWRPERTTHLEEVIENTLNTRKCSYFFWPLCALIDNFHLWCLAQKKHSKFHELSNYILTNMPEWQINRTQTLGDIKHWWMCRWTNKPMDQII